MYSIVLSSKAEEVGIDLCVNLAYFLLKYFFSYINIKIKQIIVKIFNGIKLQALF